MLFVFILTGCAAEELKLKLTVEPGEQVFTGETIKVIADGSFSDDGIEWFINGSKESNCNKKSSCNFKKDSAASLTVEVRVSAKNEGNSGLLGDVTSGLSETPSDVSKTVTLSWLESTEETNTTTTTTTTTTLAPPTTIPAPSTNNTVTISPALANVSAGSLIIRLKGNNLPTSGLTATLTGESCGSWNPAFSFTHTSAEVLLEAPDDCIFIVISSMHEITFNKGLEVGTAVTVQQNNGGNSFITLGTGTL